MLIYNKGDFDTDVAEEPLLSWIVTTTQQTAAGGEYAILFDYEDNMKIIMVDHTFGSRMIDVSQTTNTGDRVYEMIQGLLSIPHNMHACIYGGSLQDPLCDQQEPFADIAAYHDASRDPRQAHQA